MGLSPLVGVMIGALVTLTLILLVLIVRARRENATATVAAVTTTTTTSTTNKQQRHINEKPAELSELSNNVHHQQYPMQNLEQAVETDPDVIPNKFGEYDERTKKSYTRLDLFLENIF